MGGVFGACQAASDTLCKLSCIHRASLPRLRSIWSEYLSGNLDALETIPRGTLIVLMSPKALTSLRSELLGCSYSILLIGYENLPDRCKSLLAMSENFVASFRILAKMKIRCATRTACPFGLFPLSSVEKVEAEKTKVKQARSYRDDDDAMQSR